MKYIHKIKVHKLNTTLILIQTMKNNTLHEVIILPSIYENNLKQSMKIEKQNRIDII